MYKIYLDGHLLHDTYIKDLKIHNPKAVLEQNGIGSFEFIIYPSHPLNNAIKPLKSIVTVYQRDYIIFRGRVLELEVTTQNAKSVYCEGECGFMCDTVQYPYDYSGTVSGLFNLVIERHNSQVDITKQFKVGSITVTDKNDYIVRSDKTYLSTWETLKKKFIEPLGGYIQIRHEQDGNYIDYLADFTTLNSQHVVFGENMLSVKRTEDNADIATVLIPLGAKLEDNDERLTIESVNDGKLYVENTENIAKYGRIVKVSTWDDVTIASNLKTKAIALLNEMGKQVATVEINAIDMANINQDIRNFRMHSKIKVTSLFHGIDDYFVPMKMNISLFSPKNNKITLNGTISTITGANSQNQAEIGKVVQTVEKVSNDIAINVPIQLATLKKELASEIDQTATGIYTKISETTYTKEESDDLINVLSTSLSQNKEYFEMQFNSFTQDLENVLNDTNATFEDLKSIIRFSASGIEIGAKDSEFSLLLSKEKVSFMQGVQEVAYVSNSKMYNTAIHVLDTLQIGSFSFVPRSNGNLSFIKN